MEWLRDLPLKRAFFLLACGGLLLAFLLVGGIWFICKQAANMIPSGGIAFSTDGITVLPQPSPQEQHWLRLLLYTPIVASVFLPLIGLGAAGLVFYQIKLKKPIATLQLGIHRLAQNDLDFTMPVSSSDELGQLCTAFETMRAALLESNRALWQQAEERKRLNAAFAHDLRNPLTVLKGTVQLLRKKNGDDPALMRLDIYTARLAQYVEMMSSIQYLEQMTIRRTIISLNDLAQELMETADLLLPADVGQVMAPTEGSIMLDHGAFLIVAENLIGNAARFAKRYVQITVMVSENRLHLLVADDGCGYPNKLLQNGPRPFGKNTAHADHLGMGLYTSDLLCRKHGGRLVLANGMDGGAQATAIFDITMRS